MRATRRVLDRTTAARVAALGVVLACWHSPSVQALNPELAITQYSHRTWQTEQGLPQNSVFSILQTRDGYLWLATQEGLVRFDGVRFVVFNKQNTEALRNNAIGKLIEDRDGSLWIGTRGGGLTRYQNGTFTTYSKEDGLSNDTIGALWQDRDGTLWIGTRGGGLNRFQDGKFTVFTSKDGLSNDTVYSLCGDRDGNLWIGTDGGGLNRYKDGKFEVFSKKQGLSNDTVYAIHQDWDGNLWVGTGAGLNRLRDGKLTVYRVRDGLSRSHLVSQSGTLSNDNIRAIHEDRQGNLWIGTEGGLNRFREGHFSSFKAQDGLSNDSVGAIFEDREGSLWVGTDAGGLNHFRDNKFISYTTREGLSNDNARAILEDRDGSLWIGTFGGLNRFKDGKFSPYTTKNGLSSDVILSLMQDRSGALWAGTLGAGLNRLKDGRISRYSKAQGLSNETVLSLLEDRQGVIWAGTRSGGLNRFENGRFRAYTTADGLGSNDVRVLLNAQRGGIWIGTLGGGLNHFENGKFTVYTKAQGLSHEMVLDLHEDAQGVLWIGTFGGGLNRFKDGKFSAYTTKNGLFDDVVYRILEDDNGYLWMISNRGVYRVSKQELDDFAEGKIATLNSVAYGTADGMKSSEGNGAHQPAGWKTRDGRLWFPTIQGVVTIDPENIATNQQPPPVLIEELIVGGGKVDLQQAVELPPGRNKLEFRYTGLSYLAPENVRFKYRLEGFDEAWVDAGGNHTATYTNIPPGKYKFLVKASNNDGVWNETGGALELELQPYFYQRKVFYLFYLLCAAGLVAMTVRFYRRRIRELQERQGELLTLMREREQAQESLKALNQTMEQRATELARSNAELELFAYVASHDLKEPLRAVVSFLQLLSKKYKGRLDPDADQYIAYAVDGAHSMQAHIENLLSYSRVGKDDQEVTENDFQTGFNKALANLEAAIAGSGAVVTHDLLPALQVHPAEIVQLFQNLIENAIKYRSEEPPKIHVSVEPGADQTEWRFSVSDNGIGIEPQYAEKVFSLFERLHKQEDYPGTGIGLAICKKIVEGHGGRIWVESTPGKGSRFIFTLLRRRGMDRTGQRAPRNPQAGK